MIEEVSLRGSRFKDISIKEMHTIDVIGKFPEATPSKVSKELMVTLGTVTTSLNNLELHDKGYPSIGCAPCTRAVREGEDFRAGRWWWENKTNKECGLHLHK